MRKYRLLSAFMAFIMLITALQNIVYGYDDGHGYTVEKILKKLLAKVILYDNTRVCHLSKRKIKMMTTGSADVAALPVENRGFWKFEKMYLQNVTT